MSELCLFCRVVAGTLPVESIYEDAHAIAFLDIHPINPGHVLVIPKVHSSDITTIAPHEWTSLMETVRLLAPQVRDAVQATGINIGMNNGSDAGQLIFHAHIHLIPRYTNDNHQHWVGRDYSENGIHETGKLIRTHIEKNIPLQ